MPKIREASAQVKRVFCYFNNHFHGYAPENCLSLIERLGQLTEKQKEIRAKNLRKQAEKQANLSDFI
jgi:uncharacterized protein YecE (DUF72 family)